MNQKKPKGFDVFISFSVEDTGSGFTDRLYGALTKQGIYAFRESEALPRGSSIPQTVLNAIKESQFAVTILSRNYAKSASCLIDLTQIVGCANRKSGLTILPVFYGIEPTEVRKQQTGNFAEALINHKNAFPENVGEVKKWSKALTAVANLSGWTRSDFLRSGEAEVIGEITEMISKKWSRRDFKDLIGMDARIEKVKSSVLNLGSEGVLKIGISGMAGMGKTTLARAVFDNIRSEFDSCCFVPDVRESISGKGIGYLKKLLCEALQLYCHDNIQDHIMDEFLRKGLRFKKVLIVLDDVDKLDFTALGVTEKGLGPGSRVIITTRDKQTLRALGVLKDNMYEVEKLTDKEAFQLLCRKSFQGKPTPDEYIEPSYNFVKYSGGLPLALAVVGSFLCGKTVEEWSAALATLGEAAEENIFRLDENFEEKIFKILKLSYGGLGKTQKEMFLDIACFFRGENEDRVRKIFESCRFHPGIGLPVLTEKSFIRVEDNVLWMHALLQQTGWQIVREESREKPGKRSRLWLIENQHEQSATWLDKDACDVVIENSGTDAIQCLYLSPLAYRKIPLKADPFLTMRELRLLKICNVDFLDAPFEYLSNKLRVLEWHGCPLQSLPSSHQPDQLVILKLPNSRIQTLWSETLYLEKLILMDLSYCPDLIKSPDLSTAPNLEELTFEGCKNLSDVHPTVWGLQKLKVANFKDCKSLECLPNSISMQSLETLDLSNCSRLNEFPEIVGDMENLSSLYLNGTAIRELSATIQCLTGLLLLSLCGCKNIVGFPSVICSLTSLKSLLLSHCSRLDQLPEDIGSLENLEDLDACHTAIRKVPKSIVRLKNLRKLCFFACRSASSGLQLPRSFCGLSKLESLNLGQCDLAEGELPVDIGCLLSLKQLRIQENNFVSLPESISELSELTELRVTRCSKLQSLPKNLPSSIKNLKATGCPLLAEDYPEHLGISVNLEGISIQQFEGMEETPYALPVSEEHIEQVLPEFIEHHIRTRIVHELRFNLGDIPHWCNHRNRGSELVMQVSDLEVKKSLGLALFVAFEILENEDFEENWEMQPTWCIFQDEQGPKIVHDFGSFLHFKVSTHVVYCYLPIEYFQRGGMMNKATRIQAFIVTMRPDLKVKSLGMHLVFQQEITKLSRDLSASDPFVDFEFGRHCKELINNMMETEDLQLLLSKLYEGAYGREKDFGLFLPHKVIPFWFFHHYAANEALCVFPRDLFDDQKWIGLELFAVVSSGYDITVDFSLDVDLCCNELNDIGTISTSVNVNTCLGSDQLVVIHIPRVRFPKRWNQCDGIHASFRTNAPDRRIVTCGIRLLYEHDMDDWIRSITLCTSDNQDVVHSLCEHIRQLLASYLMEEPSDHVVAVEAVEQNSVEGESCRNECSFSVPRENSNLIQERRRVFTSLLHNYKSYLLQKHGVMETENIILHSKSMKIQKVPNPVFAMHHLHVMVETLLYGSFSSAEWKQLLELLLKNFKKATLSIKGQVIAVLNPFSPSSVHNCCLPQKELPGWFVLRTRKPRFAMTGLHNLFHGSSWKGLAICAAFQVHERPSTAALDNLDAGSCNVMCHLGSSADRRRCLNPAPVFSIKKEKFKWLHLGGLIWLTYIPRSYLTELQEVRDAEARIYTDPGLMLKNWSIRILFERDVEEFNQAIVQCWTSLFGDMDSLRQYVESDVNEQSSSTNRGDRGTSEPVKGYAKDFTREFLYNAIFPHRPQLMDWFVQSSTGKFLEILLPPSLSSDENWIGLALCAHFSDIENQTTTIDEMLVCHLEAAGNSSLEQMHTYLPTNEEFKWFSTPTGFIWLSCIPRQRFQDQLNDGDLLLKASFIITSQSQSQGMSVERCGLRLLYQHNEQEFKHLCTSMNSLLDEEIPGRLERHYEALDRDKGKQICTMPEGHLKNFSQDIVYNSTFTHSRRLLEWIGHRSIDPSVEIQLPSSSSSDENWIGLVLFAHFSDSENRSTFRDKASPETSVYLVCQFETENENGSLDNLHHYRPTTEEFKWLSPIGFTWLSYIPRQWFLDRPQLNICGLLKASFASETRGLFADTCGLHLLYQHDELEFKHLCINNSVVDKKHDAPQDFKPWWFFEVNGH